MRSTGDRYAGRAVRVPAAQLLRVRDAQRRRARARPARRTGTLLDGAGARSPVRGLGGRRPRRDPVHDPRRGHGLGPRRRGQLGRHGTHVGRVPATGRGRRSRSAPRAGSPGPVAGSSIPPPGSSTPSRAPSSRPRPASTSRRTPPASATSRTATPSAAPSRRAHGAPAVGPARWPPTVMTRPDPERGDRPGRGVRCRAHAIQPRRSARPWPS